MRDGNLTVIDAIFTGNQAAQLGPDTGGGAIYLEGSKHGAVIVGSTFTNNSGANAGAVGALFAELDIYNSLFQNNTATGHDANNDDASMCSVINNGQNEIGSGGNGGAIYSDGNGFNIILCGDAVLNNAAGKNAFGGGLFFTSDDLSGTLSITDTTMTGNTGGYWTNVTQRQRHQRRHRHRRQRQEHHREELDPAGDVADLPPPPWLHSRPPLFSLSHPHPSI